MGTNPLGAQCVEISMGSHHFLFAVEQPIIYALIGNVLDCVWINDLMREKEKKKSW